jgi:hypothetical protein
MGAAPELRSERARSLSFQDEFTHTHMYDMRTIQQDKIFEDKRRRG